MITTLRAFSGALAALEETAVENDEPERQNAKTDVGVEGECFAQGDGTEYDGDRGHGEGHKHQVARSHHGQNAVINQIGDGSGDDGVIADREPSGGREVKCHWPLDDPRQRDGDNACACDHACGGDLRFEVAHGFAGPDTSERIRQRATDNGELGDAAQIEMGEVRETNCGCDAKEADGDADRLAPAELLISKEYRGGQNAKYRGGSVEDRGEASLDVKLAPCHQRERDHVVQDAHDEERGPDARFTRDREPFDGNIAPKDQHGPACAMSDGGQGGKLNECDMHGKKRAAPDEREDRNEQPCVARDGFLNWGHKRFVV